MDTPEQQLSASRLVATVLREMLREERARSDRYRDALMRIIEHSDGAVSGIAREALR